MNYIVFDLETIMAHNSNMTQFIIEIGAVKIEENNGELRIVDIFHTYVKPPNPKMLKQKILTFIGASKEDFSNAKNISRAFSDFHRWIGKDEYYICIWSNSEIKILAENTMRNKFDLGWAINFNNIQPKISAILSGNKQLLSLENALKAMNKDVSKETFHSAISDAFHTANLFIENYNQIKDTLEKNTNPFSILSSQIVKTCDDCKEQKFYNKFPITKKSRSRVCRTCRMKSLIRRENYRRERKAHNDVES